MPVDPASAGIDNNANGIFLAIFQVADVLPIRTGPSGPAF